MPFITRSDSGMLTIFALSAVVFANPDEYLTEKYMTGNFG
jgi:hypothetical protein